MYHGGVVTEIIVHAFQGIHHLAIIQREICLGGILIGVGQVTQYLVIHLGVEFFQCIIAAVLAAGQRNIVTFQCLFIHFLDLLGPVLQVAVECNHPFATCMVKATIERILLPEVPAVADANDHIVAGTYPLDFFPSIIRTMVFKKNDLIIPAYFFYQSFDAAYKFLK